MAKKFAPRVSKKDRKTIDLSSKLKKDVFKLSDDRLLAGAKLTEIKLKDITVKEQVRTKFNDSSLKELSDNIKVNGLIQPLVLHKEGRKYVLICGERRFRAMSLIKLESCPCFVLENKTEEELMAIQFSENTAREQLHYIDKADGIYSYQKATKASERKIVAALGISKSEVHRSLILGKLPKKVKEAAKKFDTEKYVLLEFFALEDRNVKKKIEKMIIDGDITKRAQFRKLVTGGTVLSKGRKAGAKKPTTRKTTSMPRNLSANALLKAMQEKSKNMEMDKDTQKFLKQFLKESTEILE
jgi:ParB family chromosome partitioning protein